MGQQQSTNPNDKENELRKKRALQKAIKTSGLRYAQLTKIITPSPPGVYFKNPRILVLGRSQWGKTTLSVGLIAKIFVPYVDRIIAISPTFFTQPTYAPLRPFVGDGDAHTNEPTDETFNLIQEDVQSYYDSDQSLKTLVVLDDLSADYSTNTGRKGGFGRLILSAPHMGVSIVGIFHQATTVTATFRDNAEVIICFPVQRLEDYRIIDREFNPFNADEPDRRKSFMRIVRTAWREGAYITIIRIPRQQTICLYKFERVISNE
jgi:hypothetical protein